MFAQKTTAHEEREKNASEERANNEVEICKQVVEVDLSKEELNQRVEAFIAMFRQHWCLILAGKPGFSPAKNARSVE